MFVTKTAKVAESTEVVDGGSEASVLFQLSFELAEDFLNDVSVKLVYALHDRRILHVGVAGKTLAFVPLSWRRWHSLAVVLVLRGHHHPHHHHRRLSTHAVVRQAVHVVVPGHCLVLVVI